MKLYKKSHKLSRLFGQSSLAVVVAAIVSIIPMQNTAYADSYRRSYHQFHENYHARNRYGNHNFDNTHERDHVPYGLSNYAPRYQVVYYRPRGAEIIRTDYEVGNYLPRHARCREPARGIVAVLPPVDVGTRYVQVDNDVYLIAEATKQILDTIVLVSGR